jgi:hypothetical protein
LFLDRQIFLARAVDTNGACTHKNAMIAMNTFLPRRRSTRPARMR